MEQRRWLGYHSLHTHLGDPIWSRLFEISLAIWILLIELWCQVSLNGGLLHVGGFRLSASNRSVIVSGLHPVENGRRQLRKWKEQGLCLHVFFLWLRSVLSVHSEACLSIGADSFQLRNQ